MQNPTNIRNIRKFFKKIERGEMNFVWEPRGKTWDNATIEKICRDLELWHCVDPFFNRTVTPEKCYYRLHGIKRWRYKYEQGELEELVSLLPGDGLSYVFFNNNEMFDDALRFKSIVEDEQSWVD